MSRSLSIAELQGIFAGLSRTMAENFDLLTELDAAAGDGDLGITMSKGFAAAAKAAEGYTEKDAGRLLLLAGMAIAKEAPSTLGTLIASGLMKAGKEVAGKEAVGLAESAQALGGFVRGIMERGKCKPGEKTIVDALLPAVEALQAAGADEAFGEAWQAALAAAEKGLEATKQMKAVHGRAAYQGDNSIGKVDPGATVGVMLVRAVVEAAS